MDLLQKSVIFNKQYNTPNHVSIGCRLAYVSFAAALHSPTGL